MTRSFSFLALLLLLWMAAPAHGQSIRDAGDFFERTRTETFDIGAGGELDLRTTGSVEVIGEDRSDVGVEETMRVRTSNRERAETLLTNLSAEYEVDGSTLRVRLPQLSSNSRVSWQFVVRVPTSFTVNARTGAGPVSITGISGTVEGRTSGGPISVDRVTGTVTAETSGGPVQLSEIDGSATGTTAGGPVSAEGVTGNLEVRTSGGPIRVERVGGAVTIRTAGGQIAVRDVGGDLEARTAGGTIEVRQAGGIVRVETAGGDIELEEIAGEVSARTSGGDIEGRALLGPVTASTRAGDIQLEAIQASVNAETSVGDIELEMQSAGNDDTTLRTSHGDVELVLAPNVAVTLDVEVESGWGGRLDRDDLVSDFPVTIQSERDGSQLKASGTVNGGGPTLTVRTSGGAVEIRKASKNTP